MDNPHPQHRLAQSAAIVSAGAILSRVMGLVRDTAIAGVFGDGGPVSAYLIAFSVPRNLYEMLIGGMLGSALVPTFGEYAAREQKAELWRVASLLLTSAALVLGLAILVLESGAGLLARALAQFEDTALQTLTADLLRIVVIGVLFLGLSGIMTALSHALQRFALPAFTTAIFNASIAVFALAFGTRWRDVRVLALGLVVGSALQVVLQIPALRDMRFRPVLDLRHPVLRRVLRLYSPVVLSLVIANLGILVDRNLASRTGESSPTWMAFATTLRETPLGLVSIAISTAILPTLSIIAAQEQSADPRQGSAEPFCRTLAGGLRLVLVLTLPAAVGLFVLARPMVALLFQHGEFGATSTVQTALALRYYVIGMVFAAVDQPLVIALYARKDTLRPALVGMASVGLYLLVALPTYRTLGMVGLILADNFKHAGHVLIMIWLFGRTVGSLRGQGIWMTLLKSGLASIAMGAAIYGTMAGLGQLPLAEGKLSWVVTLLAGGTAGLGVYLGICALLRVHELTIVRSLIARRLSPRGEKTIT